MFAQSTLLVGCVACFVCGCGFTSQAPQDQRREWQERQARALTPAEMDARPARWGRRHTIRVRVHIVEGGGRTESARRDDFDDQIDRANEVLLSALDARIEVVEHRPWQPASPNADLATLLTQVVAHDPGDDVDWVIALVGSSPIATLSFNDLGRANVLGKHMILRDMHNAAELRSFDEGLDTLDAQERANLSAKRRRHKEVAVLLHEVGHLLAAIHTVDAHWIMHPTYDEEMRSYAPQNAEIMRKVLEFRAREDAKPADVFEVVRAHLDESEGWSGWVGEDLASFRAELAGMKKPEAQASSRKRDEAPSAPDPARNVEPLAPEDRASFAGLLSASESGEVAKSWDAIVALAAKYPDAYAVQRLACDAGMRARASLRVMRAHCQRMMELAKDLPGPGAQPPTPAPPAP